MMSVFVLELPCKNILSFTHAHPSPLEGEGEGGGLIKLQFLKGRET